jgi:hypothetical protein
VLQADHRDHFFAVLMKSPTNHHQAGSPESS